MSLTYLLFLYRRESIKLKAVVCFSLVNADNWTSVTVKSNGTTLTLSMNTLVCVILGAGCMVISLYICVSVGCRFCYVCLPKSKYSNLSIHDMEIKTLEIKAVVLYEK